jgi:hypothetical protein
MTTIESAQAPHKDLEIEPITVNDGDWLLTIRNRRLDEAMAIAVDALPLYKAINAVPDYEHEHEIQLRDDWKNRAESAEAKLARVEAVAHDFYKVRGDYADPHGAEALKAKLTAALADPEPFVLPTEAGAGIVATYKQTGEDKELRLFKDGKWRSSSGRTYTPERVMDFFGCHRLIEAAG